MSQQAAVHLTFPPSPEAWEALVDYLRKAAQDQANGVSMPGWSTEAAAATVALVAIRNYLMESPTIQAEPHLQQFIGSLLRAFKDLSNGIKPDLFTSRRPAANKTVRTVAEDALVGDAARLVDLYMLAGQNLNTAIQTATRRIREALADCPLQKRVTEAAVREWRKQVRSSGPKASEGARIRYNRDLGAPPGTTVSELAKGLLYQLKHDPTFRREFRDRGQSPEIKPRKTAVYSASVRTDPRGQRRRAKT